MNKLVYVYLFYNKNLSHKSNHYLEMYSKNIFKCLFKRRFYITFFFYYTINLYDKGDMFLWEKHRMTGKFIAIHFLM